MGDFEANLKPKFTRTLNGMKCFPFAVSLVSLICLAGCDSRSDTALDQAGKAGTQMIQSAASVSQKLWEKANEGARNLDLNSAETALKKGQADLETAIKTIEPGKRLEIAKSEVERIQAAICVQKLKNLATENVNAAKSLAENTGKSVNEVKSNLESLDKTYERLQSRLKEAQKTYDEATTKVHALRGDLDKALGG